VKELLDHIEQRRLPVHVIGRGRRVAECIPQVQDRAVTGQWPVYSPIVAHDQSSARPVQNVNVCNPLMVERPVLFALDESPDD
jgi:hypothetical protein